MSASLAIRPTLYEETVLGGGHTSFVLKRGQLLRLTDLEGGANVSLMLLNAQEKSERLNLPDTLKASTPPSSPPGIACTRTWARTRRHHGRHLRLARQLRRRAERR